MSDAAAPAPGTPEILVIQSKVREFAKSKDLRVSDDFISALSDEVRVIIEKAAARAAANDRKTLQKQDV